MGGVVCRFVQPSPPPQADQVRDTFASTQWSSSGNPSSLGCRLRTGMPKASTPLVTIVALVASTGSGMDQPTPASNRRRIR